jgi:N4-(beta-N-acetylglucosaminyl)-L-asparaginase
MKRITRRDFMKGAAGAGVATCVLGKVHLLGAVTLSRGSGEPVVISTWPHGMAANEAAMKVLQGGGTALEAVEKGVNVSENDPEVRSVGFGGRPDEDGVVTLDAAIMGSDGNAGAVAFLRNIKNPISVARKVMEETDHVMLVGEGALRFAKAHGFKEEELLTEESREQWLRWRQRMSEEDDWIPPEEDHDTIGMVAIDAEGNLAGACTTSGLAYKIHGRVGDSPLIGAGLYVDNDVGAAAATGKGEEVMKICGSFAVVENMRRGMSPQEACEEAVQRIMKRHRGQPNFQDAFIALNKQGEYGAAAIRGGFQFALYEPGGNTLKEGKYYMEE